MVRTHTDMITHAKKLFILSLLALAVLAAFTDAAGIRPVGGEHIVRVIDGDTLEISGGRRVRLLGVDAPERGEALFDLAADRLRELTAPGSIALMLCDSRDDYGRLLATVMAGEVNVNRVLLQEGMTLPMLIPPCGRAVAREVLEAAALGAMAGRGIYSLQEFAIVSHDKAWQRVGTRAVVRGKVLGLYRGRKAWHLNFGEDWKTDFTAVLFRDGQLRYRDLGLDPADLVGSEVLVIGKVKEYNGPEIIIHGPDQILPLKAMTKKDPKTKIQDNER